MPIRTRAAVAFGANEPLRIETLDLADPGPGEARVRLLASGLCHSDLHALDGSMASSFPTVMGHEGIGEVEAVGPDVDGLSVGDRVMAFLVPDCGKCAYCTSGRTNLCAEFIPRRIANKTPFSLDGALVYAFQGLGTFTEWTVVPADMLVKVDPAARPEQACCISCGVTTGLGAALITAKVAEGSSVAVFGCGGVGLSVVQGARLARAATIIAVDVNAEREALARKLGATHFVTAGEGIDVVAAIVAITGLGADYSFECVGIPALAEQALLATNLGWGKAVCVGVMPTGTRLSTVPTQLMLGRDWSGCLMGGAKRADVARFVDMYVAGDYSLDDLVTHTLTPDQINHGISMMRSGEAVRSVVVF